MSQTVQIADTTLCFAGRKFSFKEKLEIARQLEKLCVDYIELPEIADVKTDILLVRTASAYVKNSVLSVAAGLDGESIENARQALNRAEKPMIRIQVPVSPVGMEYKCHIKPPKMPEAIRKAVTQASENGMAVEFCAEDATRAEEAFVTEVLRTAVEAGAACVSVCDTAAELLPDDFAAFFSRVTEGMGVPVGVKCSDANGMAAASALLAAKCGAACVKTAVGGQTAARLDVAAAFVKNLGARYDWKSGIRYTELHRILGQIRWITEETDGKKTAIAAEKAESEEIRISAEDDRSAVREIVRQMGYDLSEEDEEKVLDEVARVGKNKSIGAKELDAVIASVALQVTPTYLLKNYVINNGNTIASSAQITLERDGRLMHGVCTGDGPVDAAFRTLDQIIGEHYELDDFQIRSVTEGREAVGFAVVKLRFGGKLYSGNGISTDIIGASIGAYLAAVNKIAYEETGR